MLHKKQRNPIIIGLVMYNYDLPSCTDIFNVIMHADDTTLLCYINGNPVDEHLLNIELSKITDCLSANKLSLNVNKTKMQSTILQCKEYDSHVLFI